MIGGDFNVVRYLEERRGGDHNTQNRESFNKIFSIFSMIGLIEISLNDRQFTWFNMREDPCVAKLDRVLVAKNWKARFSLAKIYSCPRLISDHTPVYLDSTGRSMKHIKLFRFEKW